MGNQSLIRRPQSGLPVETVLENLKDHAIFMIDRDARICSWNPGAEKVFGFLDAEALGKPFSIIFTREDVEAGVPGKELSIARSAGKAEDERWHLRKDGTRFWASGAVIPVAGGYGPSRYIKIVRDATDRKRAEDADRMESIGRLAGGVAHDYNNMLTAIIGYSELLSAALEDGTQYQAWVEEILSSANRAATLTQDLLAFSRKQMFKPEPVNLNDIIAKMQVLLKTTLGTQIQLVSQTDPELEDAILDRGQIGQVLMNLALNAKEAMPDGGIVTVTTLSAKARAMASAGTSIAGKASAASDATALGAASVANLGEILAGPSGEKEVSGPKNYVTLIFKDNGKGMDAETSAHAFDPFFSTKPQTTGSVGLGLSTGYGIIQQSGGTISVSSVPGAGTEFIIHLPAMDPGAHPSGKIDSNLGIKAPARNSATESPKGIILLVEDEDSVRRLAAEVLGSSGFKVLQAKDGQEGLALFEADPFGIRIVVTDVVMPIMGGLAMARKILARKPEAAFLFMSGFSEDPIPELEIPGRQYAFLPKPFTVAEILAKVGELAEAQQHEVAEMPGGLPE